MNGMDRILCKMDLFNLKDRVGLAQSVACPPLAR